MIETTSKTPEQFNLFNPAFCGLILASTIAAFSKQTEKGFPYSLSFLVLPTVLHEDMRKSVPRGGRTTMHAWMQSHGHLKIGFPERCTDLIDVTSNAISFLTMREIISIYEGNMIINSVVTKPKEVKFSEEMLDIVKCADILGKLFAGSGSTGTTYSIFGVKP
ncbi:hypothetical protein D3C87_1352050 [compost metagenome]